MSITDNWLTRLVKTNIENSKYKPWYKNDIVQFVAVLILLAIASMVITAIFNPASACEKRHLTMFVGLGHNDSRAFDRLEVDYENQRVLNVANGNPIGVFHLTYKLEQGFGFLHKSLRPTLGYTHMSSAPLEQDGNRVDMITLGIEWEVQPLW